MGILDSVLGGLGGESGGEGGLDAGQLSSVLQNLLSQHGGVEGLGKLFQEKGLEKLFSGWVSTGPNPAISADQLQGVLGPDTIGQLAKKFGLEEKQASDLLAKFLPDVIDKLTPQGQVNSNANLEQALSSTLPGLLQAGLGKFLGDKPS